VVVHSASPRLEDGGHVVEGLQPNTQYMVCVTIGNNFRKTTLNLTVLTTEGKVQERLWEKMWEEMLGRVVWGDVEEGCGGGDVGAGCVGRCGLTQPAKTALIQPTQTIPTLRSSVCSVAAPSCC